MGNTNDKLRPSATALPDFSPPTMQKRSPVVNKMIIRALRKIEQENYFSTPNSSFVPTYVFYDSETQHTLGDRERNSFSRTEKLYPIGEVCNYSDRSEPDDLNSQPLAKLTPPSIGDRSLPRSSTKENKRVNSTKVKSAKGVDMNHTGGGFSAPGGDRKPQKYFLSQNKLNTMENVKRPQSSSSKPGQGLQVKVPLKVNTSIDNLSHPNQTRSGIQMLLSPSNIADDDHEGINIGENLEKLPAKKKLYINCDFEKSLFSLPSKAQLEIMLFLIDEYVNLILISPIWYYKVNEMLEEHLLRLDNSFIKTYMSVIAFKTSYFSVAPYKFSNRTGFRMDRNIIGQVMSPLVGKTVIISFTYELKKKNAQYKATYKFDVVKKGNRHIWIHKEESKPNFDESKSAFVQPIMPVCVNDSIKLAVNFYNMSGLIDIESIKWKSPIIEAIPSIPKEINSNFLEGIDRNRICEVEEINGEWFQYKYFEHQNKPQCEAFDPQLLIQENKCAGVDIITMKTQYLASARGEVKKALQKLGITIFVVESDDEVVTEVKRSGLSHDLENFIQLRVGDKLTLYLTRG